MLQTGRHGAPRVRPALLLPAVLLLSSAVATTGLTVVPAAADGPAGPYAATPDARPVPAATGAAEDELLSDWRSGTQDQQATRERATTAAWERAAEAAERRRTAALRASRARRAAVEAARPPAPPPPEVVRPGVGPLTSRFGPRWGRLHAGIDLAAGTGAPVSAVADGVVLDAGSEGGYGNVVRVQHGQGTVSLYAHLSQVLVSAGETVPAGALLGREGSSGHSTGPHLHFEVRIGDVPVDPLEWLRARGLSL